ncbi:MAG TPA: DUF1254 domain-containing protein [Polyangiaceae bacterium]|nr:DUF1254 domain-containing protein [Polyangiaceae bacterium]
MKLALLPIALSLLFSAACSSGGKATAAGSAPDGGPDGDGGGADGGDPAALAADAFVWGYPLVVSRRTMQSLGGLVGINKLFNQPGPLPATLRIIPAPNQDTYYSIAILDLRAEPMVLTVPDVTDRYWTYQFLETFTNSFHYLGTRATGGKGGTFVITAPGWQGTVPTGAEVIESPTAELFMLGRYLVKDAADGQTVNALSRSLVPLHTLTGDPEPPAVDPPLGQAPGAPQETGTEGAAFFDELGDALAATPPSAAPDVSALARFASLGIGPGKHPIADGTGNADALSAGATNGLQRILDGAQGFGTTVNGWTTRLDIGTYSDFLTRAVVAKVAWAANVPEESVYPISRADPSGAVYDGAKSYTMHFSPTDLPSLKPLGFWSVTLYGADMFFVDNPLQRFSLGNRMPSLEYNADGSLDLYLQNAAPAGHAANWLPTPASGPFVLVTRLYLPEQTVLDGNYAVPGVVAK